jgi:plastocyanin
MDGPLERSIARRTLLRALSGVGVGVALSACAPSRPNETATPNPGNAPAPGGTPAPAATLSAASAAQSPAAAASVSPAAAPAVAPDANVQPSPVAGAAPLPVGAPTAGGPPPTIVGAPGQGPAPQPNAIGGFPVEGAASPVASPAASPAAGTGTPTPTPAATVNITADRRFDPAQVSIGRGQAVLWQNIGRAPQTVTCDPRLVSNPSTVILPPGAQPFDSGVINSGSSYSHVFDVPGDYQYVSLPFESQNMTGRVTVQA